MLISRCCAGTPLFSEENNNSIKVLCASSCAVLFHELLEQHRVWLSHLTACASRRSLLKPDHHCTAGTVPWKNVRLCVCFAPIVLHHYLFILPMRRYTPKALLCVAAVTVGVLLSTAAEALLGEVSLLTSGSCCGANSVNLTAAVSHNAAPAAASVRAICAAAVGCTILQHHKIAFAGADHLVHWSLYFNFCDGHWRCARARVRLPCTHA